MGVAVIDVLLGSGPIFGSGTQPTEACIEIIVCKGDGVSPSGGWSWPICLAKGPTTTPAEIAALAAVKAAAISAAQTVTGWEAWINAQPAVSGGTTPTISGATWWAGVPASDRQYVRERVMWTAGLP
jgi:hypothetical protein